MRNFLLQPLPWDGSFVVLGGQELCAARPPWDDLVSKCNALEMAWLERGTSIKTSREDKAGSAQEVIVIAPASITASLNDPYYLLTTVPDRRLDDVFYSRARWGVGGFTSQRSNAGAYTTVVSLTKTPV